MLTQLGFSAFSITYCFQLNYGKKFNIKISIQKYIYLSDSSFTSHKMCVLTGVSTLFIGTVLNIPSFKTYVVDI